LSGGTEENSKSFGQDGRYLGRGLSTGLLIYEVGVLVILGTTVYRLFVLMFNEACRAVVVTKAWSELIFVHGVPGWAKVSLQL